MSGDKTIKTRIESGESIEQILKSQVIADKKKWRERDLWQAQYDALKKQMDEHLKARPKDFDSPNYDPTLQDLYQYLYDTTEI